jgi:hypothetical protein
MSNLQLPDVTDYPSAARLLDGQRYRRIGYKTALLLTNYTIAVQHHHTDIIDYYPDGGISLNTGGWSTSTTTHRMHRLTPRGVRVFLRQGVTYVETPLREATPVGHGIVLSPEEVAAEWEVSV